MKLYLLRHGQTEGSLRNLYYGAANIPVLPESLEELHAAAQRGLYPKAQRYYTSGLLRTEQTLAAIYGDVPHTQLPGLREMDFGDFEMHSYEELKDWPSYQKWIEDVEHNPCPNGESAPLVLARNIEAIAPVLAADEDAVCVAHGGVISGLLMTWFGGIRYDYLVRPGTGFARRGHGRKAAALPADSGGIKKKTAALALARLSVWGNPTEKMTEGRVRRKTAAEEVTTAALVGDL